MPEPESYNSASAPMEYRSTSLEAVSLVAIPVNAWNEFTTGAGEVCAQVFPHALVSLKVVAAAEIRRLNQSYRGVDAPTDVLSFPARDHQVPLAVGNGFEGHAGDIAMSWTAVEQQALANGNSPGAEALALLAHGVLHLAGYDHRNDREQLHMDELTVDLCRRAGVEVKRFGH